MFDISDFLTALINLIVKLIQIKSFWACVIVFSFSMLLTHNIWIALIATSFTWIICFYVISSKWDKHLNNQRLKDKQKADKVEHDALIKENIINGIGQLLIDQRDVLNQLVKNNAFTEMNHIIGPHWETANGTMYKYFEVKEIDGKRKAKIKSEYYSLFKAVYIEFSEDFKNVPYSDSLWK